MNRFLRIHPADNVLVVLQELQKCEILSTDNGNIEVLETIPVGHKIALCPINKGDIVIKYGYSIGHATEDIKAGEHIHAHNLKTGLNDNLEYKFKQKIDNQLFKNEERTFQGYVRKNGEVGIRNELWIVPTVGCVNGQAKIIADTLKASVDTSHIDDIVVMNHQYGCSQLGEDHVNTQKALASLIHHPNAGGILVLGLGCENNQISTLKSVIESWDTDRVQFLVAQEVEDEVATGLEIVTKLAERMKQDERKKASISKLKIGLKCGGSDGFSGITANPLLGNFTDWMVAQGGTCVLTEVPEMFGAENILMERSADKLVFRKTVDLINSFKDYFRANNQVIYENPSPGNKDGGITTLEEKSLGCVQKGGTAVVTDVISYGERIQYTGLQLLCAPGNDLVASSALGFSGCQLILFSTGRGTPFGSFVPTMKIATNTHLFEMKSNWMDFNAGELLVGKSMTEMREELIGCILEVANGKKLKHEFFNNKEVSIFKTGVTL